MTTLFETLRKNRTLLITLSILALLQLMAIQGLSTKDWVVTLLRGLAVGAITFLVASGLSLIFGLLDVLNLAHGTLFMLGAYIGWTVYVRPDTFIDLLAPVALLAAGLFLEPLFRQSSSSSSKGLNALSWPAGLTRALPWIGLILAIGIALLAFSNWPIAKWDLSLPSASPSNDALQLDLALKAEQPRTVLEPSARASLLTLLALLLAGGLAAASMAHWSRRQQGATDRSSSKWRLALIPLLLLLIGLTAFLANDWLSEQLFKLDTTWLFFVAILVALLSGIGLGGIMEATLIRPLYARPIYQLMLTLGLGVSGIEIAQAIWGRPEFTMPKPTLFRGASEGCPAANLADLIQNHCSILAIPIQGETMRIRLYNEIFVILIGLIVLVAVWVLLQRSRLGMIIRAGVQDSEMVEALGINVRQVFTFVFALGAGLATLGGIIAAPSMGLSPLMGESLLLQALIALAIGGLTSFPGAAAGSVLVGLLQQFIIKYGQIGIKLPFLAEPFKPTPPLVPASTVLLMVIVLLVLPQGLFGRKE